MGNPLVVTGVVFFNISIPSSLCHDDRPKPYFRFKVLFFFLFIKTSFSVLSWIELSLAMFFLCRLSYNMLIPSILAILVHETFSNFTLS